MLMQRNMRRDYRRVERDARAWDMKISSYLFDTCKCMRVNRMKYLLAERCRGDPHRSVSRSGTRDHLDNRSDRTVPGMAASGPGTGNDRR